MTYQPREPIDVVIPVFDEEMNLFENMSLLTKYLYEQDIRHRIILVDDGSSDRSWEEILRLISTYESFTGISFSRNFGKEAAVAAGLAHVTAPACVVMDADLQHPMDKIPEFIGKWREGFQIVEGVKTDRGRESVIYKTFAKLFYRIFKGMAGFDFENSSDFKLLDKRAVDAFNSMGDSALFFRGMVGWMGFTKCQVPFAVRERQGDGTKLTTGARFRMAGSFITSFSGMPLYLTNLIGLIFFIAGLILAVQTLYNKLTGAALSGFTTVIILILLATSAILFCLGVIGAYLSRIYEETKRRPRFIVREKRGQHGNDNQQSRPE